MFSITSYNDTYIPINKQDTLYETEIKELNEMFEEWNRERFPEDYKQKFQKIPGYIRFALQDIFTKVIMLGLEEVFAQNKKYKGNTLKIVKDMYDIYWYDDQNVRHFVFNINVRNDTLKWTRRLKVYAKLNGISDIVSDTGEYIVDLDPVVKLRAQSNLFVVTFSLEEPIVRFKLPGFNDQIGSERFDSYYNILNPLHLMDPYITTGKYMVITEDMRRSFADELEQRERRQKEKSKGGFCYNTTNLLANTKEECIESGGIWDYAPDTPYECPYYLANENYPNDFGGLQGDKCQMVKNMQIIGHRNFSMDPQYRPVCYNCDRDTSILIGEGTLGYCCDDQNDKSKYPGLITPDYAFENDQETRGKYSELLAQRGLSVI